MTIEPPLKINNRPDISKGKSDMSDWLHRLPVAWMAVVVFGATYLFAAAIYATVMSLASGERARAFKAVSPGMLPPLGILFALFVTFTAAQVWNDNDRAGAAVDREERIAICGNSRRCLPGRSANSIVRSSPSPH